MSAPTVQLGGNARLVTPPREVASRGAASVKEFLKELRRSGSVDKILVRLMLVGWASAGKTKLNFALQGRPAEYSGASTRGIDTSSWAPDWMQEPAEFRSWDFAGQEVYYAMHRLFLSDRALYLLLVDLSTPSPDTVNDPQDSTFSKVLRDTVHFWIDSLAKRTNGAPLLVIGTKVDRLGAEAVERRRKLLLSHLQQEKDRVLSSFQSAHLTVSARLALPETVDKILLSGLPNPANNWAPTAVEGGRDKQEEQEESIDKDQDEHGGGVDWSAVDRSAPEDYELLAKNYAGPIEDPAPPPSVDISAVSAAIAELASTDTRFRMSLPTSWLSLLEAVDRVANESGLPYLVWEEYSRKMLPILSSPGGGLEGGAGEGEGRGEASLRTATLWLHDVGIVLWYHEDPRLRTRIFLRPQWVVDLLKPILGHELIEQFDAIPADLTKLSPSWPGCDPALGVDSQRAQLEKHRLDMIG